MKRTVGAFLFLLVINISLIAADEAMDKNTLIQFMDDGYYVMLCRMDRHDSLSSGMIDRLKQVNQGSNKSVLVITVKGRNRIVCLGLKEPLIKIIEIFKETPGFKPTKIDDSQKEEFCRRMILKTLAQRTESSANYINQKGYL